MHRTLAGIRTDLKEIKADTGAIKAIVAKKPITTNQDVSAEEKKDDSSALHVKKQWF